MRSGDISLGHRLPTPRGPPGLYGSDGVCVCCSCSIAPRAVFANRSSWLRASCHRHPGRVSAVSQFLDGCPTNEGSRLELASGSSLACRRDRYPAILLSLAGSSRVSDPGRLAACASVHPGEDCSRPKSHARPVDQRCLTTRCRRPGHGALKSLIQSPCCAILVEASLAGRLSSRPLCRIRLIR